MWHEAKTLVGQALCVHEWSCPVDRVIVQTMENFHFAPCGSGLDPRTLWVSVSGQASCDLTSDPLKLNPNRSITGTCMEHSIAYQKPVVDGICASAEDITTEGGLRFNCRGKNFIAEKCFDPLEPHGCYCGTVPVKIKIQPTTQHGVSLKKVSDEISRFQFLSTVRCPHTRQTVRYI